MGPPSQLLARHTTYTVAIDCQLDSQRFSDERSSSLVSAISPGGTMLRALFILLILCLVVLLASAPLDLSL